MKQRNHWIKCADISKVKNSFAEETIFYSNVFSRKKISQNNEGSWNKEVTVSSVYISKVIISFAEENIFFQFFSSRKKISQNNENSRNKEINKSNVYIFKIRKTNLLPKKHFFFLQERKFHKIMEIPETKKSPNQVCTFLKF